jgi:hypothetical protein
MIRIFPESCRGCFNMVSLAMDPWVNGKCFSALVFAITRRSFLSDPSEA